MRKVNWQYLIDALLFVSVTAIVIIGLLLAFVIPKGPSATDSAKYFLGLHRHEWGDIHLCLGIAFTILGLVHIILGWNWIKGKTQGLFGNKWKAALVAACLLPLAVLAVSWTLFPGEPSIYGHDDTGSVSLDRGILEVGQLPPYNPYNAVPEDTDRPVTSKAIPLESASNIQREEEHRPALHSDEEARLTRGRSSEDVSGILITGQTTLHDIERQTGISARVVADRLGLPRSTSTNERLGRLRKSYPFTLRDVRDIISSLLEQKSAL